MNPLAHFRRGIFRKKSYSINPAQQAIKRLQDRGSSIDRMYALMYLVAKRGYLKRSEVERLSYQIYADSEIGHRRPLSDCLVSAHIARPKDRLLYDTLLRNVSLSYSTEEMQEKLSLEPRKPYEMPRSIVDWKAGEDAPRPLLLDLYTLECRGEVLEKEVDGEETFLPTVSGRGHSKMINEIFVYGLASELEKQKLMIIAEHHESLSQFVERRQYFLS